MKKLIVFVLCCLFCLLPVCLTGCDNSQPTSGTGACECTENNAGLYNLDLLSAGDEIPVYPQVEFNYQVNEQLVIHVSSIKVYFVAKNTIAAGDTLGAAFFPYTIRIVAQATTSAEWSGSPKTLYLRTKYEAYTVSAAVGGDGTLIFDGEVKIHSNDLCGIHFNSII